MKQTLMKEYINVACAAFVCFCMFIMAMGTVAKWLIPEIEDMPQQQRITPQEPSDQAQPKSGSPADSDSDSYESSHCRRLFDGNHDSVSPLTSRNQSNRTFAGRSVCQESHHEHLRLKSGDQSEWNPVFAV